MAGTPVLHRRLRHHHRAQHHHRADREVDARGEDDEGLRDGERADDGDLLRDEREVRRVEEAVVEEPEHDHGDDQHDGRADRRVAVQHVADAAERGGAVEELLGQVERRGRRCSVGRADSRWFSVFR